MRTTDGHPQFGTTRLPNTYPTYRTESLFSGFEVFASIGPHYAYHCISSISGTTTYFLCLFVHVTLQVISPDL